MNRTIKLEEDLRLLKEVNRKYLNEIKKLKGEKSKIQSELNQKNKEIEDLKILLQRFKTKYFVLKKGGVFTSGVYISHPVTPKHKR